MKRNILSVCLMIIFSIVCFAGCGQDPPPENKLSFYVSDTLYYTVKTDGYKVIEVPTTPKKQGYSFEGWYYDKDVWDFPFTKFDFEKKPVNGSINIYAKFRQNYIGKNINFYSNNNLYATVNTPGFETIAMPSNPTKNNCVFAGWYFDDGTFLKPFNATTYANKKLDQNISVYAKFIHNDGTIYKISFMAEDLLYYTINTAGNTILNNLPISPEKDDYMFIGWYLDNGTWQQPFNAQTFASTYLTEDITVYAYFRLPNLEQTTFNVTFIADGETVSTVTSAGHETITPPTAPDKEGYDFVGWYLDDTTFTRPYDETYFESIAIFEDVNIYAKYELAPEEETGDHSITFYAEGSEYAKITTAGNTTLTLPEEPYSDTHTFAGWYYDNETFTHPLTANTFASIPLTENIAVYAKFVADAYESDLEFVLSEDESYYIVVGLGRCQTSPNILIPNTYNNLPVKEIVGATYDEHFSKIYDGLFYGNDYVKKLKISANIEVIGPWAVSGCDNLVKVEFAENSKLHTLGRMAFNHSTSIKSISLPKGVTSLPEYAFSHCESLSSFTFENLDTFTELGPYAINATAITALKLPNSLVKIGENCFSDCASLAEINLPKTLKTIEEGAFNDCRKLKYVELEDTDAWCGIDIQGPWGVPFNWAHGFYQNGERVTNLVISEGVKEIKKFAFADCQTLQSITIPSTVELLESCSFADILKLKVLNYNAKNCKINYFHSSSHYYVFEHCGAWTLTGMAPGYQYPEGAKHITLNIGATVENIPANLFNYAGSGFQPLIKTVNFLGSTPPTFGNKWLVATGLIENFSVPAGTEQAYLTNLGSSFAKFFETNEG